MNDMGSRMVISGSTANMFHPNEVITRAEFAAIMVRGLGLAPIHDSHSFVDVEQGAWYSDAVQTAAMYKLIRGFEDDTFRPMERITREQAMVVLAHAMTITNLFDKFFRPSPMNNYSFNL